MRRIFPLIVLVLAVLLYTSRETVFHPFRDSNHHDSIPAETTPALEKPEKRSQTDLETVQTGVEASHTPLVTQGKINPGSSFFLEMQNAGVSHTDIDRLVKDSRKTFNLKRVHPGQAYSLYKSQKGDIDSLCLSLRGDKLLKIRRSGERFQAVIDTLPYQITYHVTSGTIHQSLFATLQAKGANPDLASRLAHIFGWEIDFYTDIREGDHYTVLYEKISYENGRTTLGRILAARILTRGKNHHAFAYKAAGRSPAYYDIEGKSLQKSLLRSPLSYNRVTSNFSWNRYNPVTHHYAPHLGVDYGAPYGTPVKSTGDGVIVAATRGRENGNYVKIRHNRSYTTYYLHLSRFAKGIRRGSKVRQGQVIGYVGSTGRSTGPHLCYRIKVGNRFVNPRTINLPSKDPVPKKEFLLFEKVRDACLIKLLRGSVNGEEGKTVLVEEPTLMDEDRVHALF